MDEADKAPTNVTCILKTLVESSEMHLSDGRRIVSGRRRCLFISCLLVHLNNVGLLRNCSVTPAGFLCSLLLRWVFADVSEQRRAGLAVDHPLSPELPHDRARQSARLPLPRQRLLRRHGSVIGRLLAYWPCRLPNSVYSSVTQTMMLTCTFVEQSVSNRYVVQRTSDSSVLTVYAGRHV